MTTFFDEILTHKNSVQRFSGYPKFNLTGGHNDMSLIPVAELAQGAMNAIMREGPRLAMYNMGYGPQGYLPLRQLIASRLNAGRGSNCSADDVLITTGSGHGIDLVADLFVNRGGVVLCEEHTFSYCVRIFKKLGAEVVGLPMDESGIDIDRLTQIIERLKRDGKKIDFLYTIPTVQNPTGTILPFDRRVALISLITEHSIPVVEDECYTDLIWDKSDTPNSLYSLAPDRVVFLGSFSKNLAPSIRIGYVVGHWSVLGRLMACRDTSGTGAVDQLVAYEYFKHHADAHISDLISGLQKKMHVMKDCLDEFFGTTVECTLPKGGLFLWVKFPENCDARKLANGAAERGIGFNIGSDWSCDPEVGKSHIRLCFALPSETEIREGVRELADLAFETFGLPERTSNVKN